MARRERVTAAAPSADLAASILAAAAADDLQLEVDQLYTAANSPWSVPAYRFEIVHEGQKAGTISLRVSNEERLVRVAGHIGFGISEQFRGRRLAGRAVRRLLPLAAHYRLNPLWLSCNPDNLASMQVMNWLGAIYVETVDLPPDDTRYYPRGERQKRRYRLDY
jgi:tagatose 1,6-diphosphate aldolase